MRHSDQLESTLAQDLLLIAGVALVLFIFFNFI